MTIRCLGTSEMVNIFVSYSHLDKRWVDPADEHNLVPFLNLSLAKDGVRFWYDGDLGAGDDFRAKIQTQIEQSEIAILLVSQHFLNSEFIRDEELPQIEARLAAGAMRVAPILVGSCDWQELSVVGSRHMLPGFPKPLIVFVENEATWDAVRHEILQAIRKMVRYPPPPPPPPRPTPPPTRSHLSPTRILLLVVALAALVASLVWMLRGSDKSRSAPHAERSSTSVPKSSTVAVQAGIEPTLSIQSQFRFVGPGYAIAGAFSPDGRHVMALFSGLLGIGAEHPVIRVWEMSSRRQVMECPIAEYLNGAGAFSTDRTQALVAYSSPKGGVGVIDIAAHAELHHLDAGVAESLIFSRDGRQALVAGPHDFQIWDLDVSKVVHRFSVPRARPIKVAIDPDGRRVALVGEMEDTHTRIPPRTMSIWEVASSHALWLSDNADSDFLSVAVSEDGHRLLAGRKDKVDVLDMRTGTRVASLVSGGGYTHSVAFSSDGKKAASGGQNSVLCLWDVSNLRSLGCSEGAQLNTVQGVAFSPDGQMVLAASANGLDVYPVPP